MTLLCYNSVNERKCIMMAEAAILRHKIDKTLKNQAETLFESMGLTPAAAIKLFYKQTVLAGALPFAVKAEEPFYSEANQLALKAAIARLDAGYGTEHELIEVKENCHGI